MLAAALIACGAPSPSVEGASAAPASGAIAPAIVPVPGDGVVADLGTIVVPVQPRWQPGRTGTVLTDDWGEHEFVLEPPVPVSVVDGPIRAEGEDWFHVYVLPDAMRWPSDFYAWVPASLDGREVVVMADEAACPAAQIEAMATLSPAGRLACFGDQPLEFEARSWLAGHYLTYDVEPDWLGTPVEGTRSVSLFAPDGGQFPRPPDSRLGWIDARVPPDVPLPPAEVTLRVSAQFDHPDARGCSRTRDRSGPPPQPALAGLPDEPPATSEAWCRGQLVLTGWEIVLGPEGRPPVAGEVQLHRTAFEGDLCAGVGMPQLVFRMDPDVADPIWLEPVHDGSAKSIPVFGAGFSARLAPDLEVVGPSGEVVARNGTRLDPDANLGPYAVCPMGDTVSITSR